MRDGCALLLRDKRYNDTDSEQTRNQRDSKQTWVVVIKNTQQPQCGGRADNRTDRVQHSLEAKGASVCLACDSSSSLERSIPFLLTGYLLLKALELDLEKQITLFHGGSFFVIL
jgi:hypothetical protein